MSRPPYRTNQCCCHFIGIRRKSTFLSHHPPRRDKWRANQSTMLPASEECQNVSSTLMTDRALRLPEDGVVPHGKTPALSCSWWYLHPSERSFSQVFYLLFNNHVVVSMGRSLGLLNLPSSFFRKRASLNGIPWSHFTVTYTVMSSNNQSSHQAADGTKPAGSHTCSAHLISPFSQRRFLA